MKEEIKEFLKAVVDIWKLTLLVWGVLALVFLPAYLLYKILEYFF